MVVSLSFYGTLTVSDVLVRHFCSINSHMRGARTIAISHKISTGHRWIGQARYQRIEGAQFISRIVVKKWENYIHRSDTSLYGDEGYVFGFYCSYSGVVPDV